MFERTKYWIHSTLYTNGLNVIWKLMIFAMWFQQISIFHINVHLRLNSIHRVFKHFIIIYMVWIDFTLFILFHIKYERISFIKYIACNIYRACKINKFYPKRGITWFVGRWRTQQTARIYVNCRTHEHRHFERILRFILTSFFTEAV